MLPGMLGVGDHGPRCRPRNQNCHRRADNQANDVADHADAREE